MVNCVNAPMIKGISKFRKFTFMKFLQGYIQLFH